MISPTNFTCTNIQSVFVCKANNAATLALFRRLQAVIHEGCMRITQSTRMVSSLSDGVLGPLMVLGAQRVLSVLNHWQPIPQNLTPFLNYGGNEEELVRHLATCADEFIGYVAVVLRQHPTAFTATPTPREEASLGTVSEVDLDLKRKLKFLTYAGLTLGTAGGLVFATRRKARQRMGLEDHANKLIDDMSEEEEDDSPEKG